ncbi:Protein of unknown function DUF3405 [Penicillium capsulatum]|uniref:Uncharacterized protein n=1 Tax=Penicillium capsulatum TaxID=69766 RepID=A0A9W9LI32_9EURO|nr:Protein of unknown function DUF3405 [Penicillium capsulatum]KAJ6107027.1 Protein of unknown function DUF3405 [Penicillium capsulatum]
MCTNRVSRYSPYGYVDAMAHNRTDDTVGSKSASHVQWEKVNWASLQRDCLQRNGPRFHTIEPREKKIWTLDKRLDRPDESKTEETNPKALPRTAVILRSWLNMKYKENDLHHIRAMIMEMSLASGGEYEVVLLVDCHDEKLPDPHNQAAIDQFKEQHLPQELREIAVFFNKKMLRSWYPDIDEHEAIVQYYQPTQIYSRLHPQYDYIWQFEMDSRYTGHYYSLVHQATEFAKQQPRKHLWERNSYFYMPAVHGSWENFTEKVDRDMVGLKSVWGAVPTESILVEGEAPIPPVRTPAEDHYEWGVGEEADLITWLPHFDPTDTDWPFKDKVYNFPEGRNIPRRSAVVAMSRVSKKLLRVMHDDKVRGGYGLASEMSCVSWALFYGLKAVQIPLPVYHEHDWDPQELNRRANAGKPGRINAEMDSLWSWELNDDIIFGSNFNFNSDFSGKLFRAWMGLDSAAEWEEENPRLCFPPILFHPVKDLSPN